MHYVSPVALRVLPLLRFGGLRTSSGLPGLSLPRFCGLEASIAFLGAPEAWHASAVDGHWRS
jgi:hypothetical protein